MTIKNIYKIINKTMQLLENIDFINLEKRKYNQEQVNKAYKVLDNFRDELIRENIKNKQGENKWKYIIYLRRHKRYDKRRFKKLQIYTRMD